MANSNWYAWNHMTEEGTFGGSNWTNITAQQMIHFHGIVLKRSVGSRSLGGCISYFTEQMSVNLPRSYSVLLSDCSAWALKIISQYHFKQIRAACNPEVGKSIIGDKCHQLCHTLNTLNQASFRAFIPGWDLSFDEGSVASWSWSNPVRQYNRISLRILCWFFELCNNSPGK